MNLDILVITLSIFIVSYLLIKQWREAQALGRELGMLEERIQNNLVPEVVHPTTPTSPPIRPVISIVQNDGVIVSKLLTWTTTTGAGSGDGMLYGQPSNEISHPAYKPNYLNQLTKCKYCGKVEDKCTCGGFGYA